MEAEPTIKVELTQSEALCLAGEYTGESPADTMAKAQGDLIAELHSHGLWPVDQ